MNPIEDAGNERINETNSNPMSSSSSIETIESSIKERFTAIGVGQNVLHILLFNHAGKQRTIFKSPLPRRRVIGSQM